MIRRQFLSAGLLSSASLLGLGACSTLQRFSALPPITAELSGKLTTAPMFWTNIMLHAARSQNINPLIASRTFAFAHFAGYLAMTGDGLSVIHSSEVPANLHTEAAYGVAFSLALEEALSISLALPRKQFLSELNQQNHVTESVQWAKAQAKRVIQWRTNDGAEDAYARIYPPEYKKQHHALSWSPTGPFYGAKNGPGFTTFERGIRPAWGQQMPWMVKSVSHYEATPFPKVNSTEFIRQYNKVKAIGGTAGKDRTAEHDEIALFWEDGLMGITPPGHFQLIAMQLLSQRELNATKQAKLFALHSMALADAGIIAWHNKYLYDVVRPETAIRFAKSRFSNTPQLNADKNWTSYIPTPPFPTYVSGHSIFGAASCDVLTNFFETDRIKLTSPAPDMVNWPKQLKGVRRHFNSLRQIAEENGMSREYGGVHWEIDNLEGLRLGYAIAKQCASHCHWS